MRQTASGVGTVGDTTVDSTDRRNDSDTPGGPSVVVFPSLLLWWARHG